MAQTEPVHRRRPPPAETFWVKTPRQHANVTPPTSPQRREQGYRTPEVATTNPLPIPGSATSSWLVCFDESSGYEYYYNYKTKESAWELPKGAILAKDTLSPDSSNVRNGENVDDCEPRSPQIDGERREESSSPVVHTTPSSTSNAPQNPSVSTMKSTPSSTSSSSSSTSPKRSVSEMKQIIRDHGLSSRDCVTKEDLRKRMNEALSTSPSSDVNNHDVSFDKEANHVEDNAATARDDENSPQKDVSPAPSIPTTPSPSSLSTSANEDVLEETAKRSSPGSADIIRHLRTQIQYFRENEEAAEKTFAAKMRLQQTKYEEMQLEVEEFQALQHVLRGEHKSALVTQRNELEEEMCARLDASEQVLRRQDDEIKLKRSNEEMEEMREQLLSRLNDEMTSATRLRELEIKQRHDLDMHRRHVEERESAEARNHEALRAELLDAKRMSEEKHATAMLEHTDARDEVNELREKIAREAHKMGEWEQRHTSVIDEMSELRSEHEESMRAGLRELKKRLTKKKRKALRDMESTAMETFEEYEAQEAKRLASRDEESEREMEKRSKEYAAMMSEFERDAEMKREHLEEQHADVLREQVERVRIERERASAALEREQNAMDKARAESLRAHRETEEHHHYRTLWIAEAKRRRELQTELVDLRGNIRVLCRVRPMLPFEIEREGKDSVCVSFPFASTTEDGLIDVVDRRRKNRFEFDAVFRESSTQVEIFNQVHPLVMKALDGFNVCIFAYGQTGSGKTYTMEGDEGPSRGVYSRAMEALFEMSNRRELSAEASYTFKMSVVEIYNDTVRDLLVDRDDDEFDDNDRGRERAGLNITIQRRGGGGRHGARSMSPRASGRRRGAGEVVIEGLTIETVRSADEMARAVKRCAKARAVGSHNVNERSSRSHLIITMYVEGRAIDGESDRVSRAKLHLIDLAGSERISKTHASGKQLREAKFINKSLSALGDVISALSEGKKHVPFRNSKLTFALQDSLSGQSKVLMFVNCSPASSNSSETTCSLRFAARCRKCALGQAKANVTTVS